jgi:hypothetical protein
MQASLKNRWKAFKSRVTISGINDEYKLISGLYVKPVPEGCLMA